MKLEFEEEQYFRQWWLWLLLAGVAIMPIFGLYKQIVMGTPFGDHPMSDKGLMIVLLVIFGVLGLFWWLRLTTEIDQKEIRVQFSPFANRTIQWADVQSAEVLDYGFVGGWGIRLWTKYGTVYNTQGRIGLAIVMKNGKKFLVGTQKEQELKAVIERIAN